MDAERWETILRERDEVMDGTRPAREMSAHVPALIAEVEQLRLALEDIAECRTREGGWQSASASTLARRVLNGDPA